MGLKTCKGCSETKDESEFYPNKTAVNGGNICRACKRVRDARYRKNNPDKVKATMAAFLERDGNRERYNAKEREKAKLLKAEIIKVYGGECECCQETILEFLTIDHPNKDGKQHRALTGSHVYADLKRRGFPPGFRVLCMNCNFADGRYGQCPHTL